MSILKLQVLFEVIQDTALNGRGDFFILLKYNVKENYVVKI